MRSKKRGTKVQSYRTGKASIKESANSFNFAPKEREREKATEER